jgi:hypothetical protein
MAMLIVLANLMSLLLRHIMALQMAAVCSLPGNIWHLIPTTMMMNTCSHVKETCTVPMMVSMMIIIGGHVTIPLLLEVAYIHHTCNTRPLQTKLRRLKMVIKIIRWDLLVCLTSCFIVVVLECCWCLVCPWYFLSSLLAYPQ